MGLFDFLKGPDIQQGVRECGETPGAVLLDVPPVCDGQESREALQVQAQ